MDLLGTLMGAGNSAGLEQLGRQFGLDQAATKKVLGQLVPALGQGLRSNAGSADGLSKLASALQTGGHEQYLDKAALLGQAANVSDGNNILGHVFGSKDVSRKVAAQAAAQTGVSDELIKKMLPVVATMVMGTLSKQTQGGKSLAGGADLLGGLLGSGKAGAGLDSLVKAAGKFF